MSNKNYKLLFFAFAVLSSLSLKAFAGVGTSGSFSGGMRFVSNSNGCYLQLDDNAKISDSAIFSCGGGVYAKGPSEARDLAAAGSYEKSAEQMLNDFCDKPIEVDIDGASEFLAEIANYYDAAAIHWDRLSGRGNKPEQCRSSAYLLRRGHLVVNEKWNHIREANRYKEIGIAMFEDVIAEDLPGFEELESRSKRYDEIIKYFEAAEYHWLNIPSTENAESCRNLIELSEGIRNRIEIVYYENTGTRMLEDLIQRSEEVGGPWNMQGYREETEAIAQYFDAAISHCNIQGFSSWGKSLKEQAKTIRKAGKENSALSFK